MTTPVQPGGSRATENRLDGLREEAGRTGRVSEAGIPIAGGPIPRDGDSAAGYYGQPLIKPPVWTWQIGLYFFVGGTAGMSGVIALASLLTGQSLDVVRAAVRVALAGALISPVLLIWDLGRPMRFLNMLRVFKWRSPMSVGVWTLVLFSAFAGSAFVALEASIFLSQSKVPAAVSRAITFVLVGGTALTGVVLATYTGVLLGATVVPVWSAHHRLLPFHFGMVALGSAAAVLELTGFRLAALNAIGLSAAAAETCLALWLEADRKNARARAIREGTPGRLLRIAEMLTGPVTLLARMAGWVTFGGVSFLIGAVFSRYAWLLAGRNSARNPEETVTVR